MLDGIGLHVLYLLYHVFFVSDGMLIVSTLPYPGMTPTVLGQAQRAFGFVFDRLGQEIDEASLDLPDDVGIAVGFIGSDDHMQMIRQYHDGIDVVFVVFLAFAKSFAEQINMLDQERFAPIRYECQIVAVSWEE
jgi:hypothetical protein